MTFPIPGSLEQVRLLLRPPDAARALAISQRALHELAKSGEIKRTLIGRSVRYDLRDLMAFIDAKKETAQ